MEQSSAVSSVVLHFLFLLLLLLSLPPSLSLWWSLSLSFFFQKCLWKPRTALSLIVSSSYCPLYLFDFDHNIISAGQTSVWAVCLGEVLAGRHVPGAAAFVNKLSLKVGTNQQSPLKVLTQNNLLPVPKSQWRLCGLRPSRDKSSTNVILLRFFNVRSTDCEALTFTRTCKRYVTTFKVKS